jgi:hypothetical protein
MQDPGNAEELLLTWDLLSSTPDVRAQLVALNAECFTDIKDNKGNEAVIDVFTTLVEKGKLSSSNVRNSLLDTVEFVDSLVCDARKANDCLGDMLCAMFLVKRPSTWVGFASNVRKPRLVSQTTPRRLSNPCRWRH